MAKIHVAPDVSPTNYNKNDNRPPTTNLRLQTKLAVLLVLGLPLLISLRRQDILGICIMLSIMAGLTCHYIIPNVGILLARAGRVGRDLNKLDKPYIPESLGIVAGTVYLIALFIFLPFPFFKWFLLMKPVPALIPFQKLGEYTAALLSICAMLFLGFADDVLNLKWRHKIFLPALATLPLLMIYSLTFGVTAVVVPLPLRFIFGELVDLGSLYYLYMALLAIFCTHSINILAGVNGVEVGQGLVIGSFVLLTNVASIWAGEGVEQNSFSLYLILPFISVSLSMWWYNWFPARIFVGDTYCYFSGMLFAVVAIHGHFSKTLMLYFVPQIINFLYSTPQLFGLLPCPRHRLPRLNPETGLLEPSRFTLKYPSHPWARRALTMALRLRLLYLFNEESRNLSASSLDLGRCSSESLSEGVTVNNLTLLNLLLVHFGPMREDHLAVLLLGFHTATCLIGFLIRHQLSKFIFP